MSNIDFTPAIDCLSSASSIAITCHVRPDGDALGSAVGLSRLLRGQGKNTRIILPSILPGRYAFMFDQPPQVIEEDWQQALLPEFDVIVVLDTAVQSQLSAQFDFLRSCNSQILVIDHHLPGAQQDLGTVRLIDPTASSVGLLVTELAQTWSGSIDEPTAEALFVALATDTGWFRLPNADARTYNVAAWLTQAGASPSKLYEVLYLREPPGKLRLTGRALNSLELLQDDRLACTVLLLEDFSQAQAEPADTEDLVNEPLRISSVVVSMMLTEQPDGTRISLRSKRQIDVAAVAAQFGGGGHKLAAGARLPFPPAQAKQQLFTTLAREFARLDQSGPNP